jgi:signal transduction histidine kinase
MSTEAPSLPTERAIYRDYERDRRLRLALTLLPIFAVIQGAVFLVSLLVALRVHYEAPYAQLFLVNTVLVGVDALLHTLGIRFARQGRVGPATLLVVIPVGITILVPALSYGVVVHFAPVSNSPVVPISLSVVTAATILIVLAGLLVTTRVALLVSTLVVNLFSLYIMANVLSAPGIGSGMTSSGLLLLIFPLCVQWATAGILYATSETYVQTLRELGDVRVAYERVQQLDQLKDQFITHINHELRNPVMALLGHVELLLLTDESLSHEERRNYLERAKRTGDQLASLVNSILAARGLEQQSSQMTVEVVRLQEALDAALDLVDPREGQHIERKLDVSFPDGLAVWGSVVRVRQIFTNLLSNAVKYSVPGTPIEISARIWDEKGQDQLARSRSSDGSGAPASTGQVKSGMVDITVRDHGLGIPPDQIPLLFNRFVRLPRDLASSIPGNGLGLYLCMAYAEAMGGTIWAESTGVEGEGSTFHLCLPAPPMAVDSSSTSSPSAEHSDEIEASPA